MIKHLIFAFVAMLLWASSALILLKVSSVPAFFLEAVLMSCGGLFLLVLARERVVSGFSLWGVLGVAGNHLTYILALRMIPPPALDIIYCTWPVIVFFMSHKKPIGLQLWFGLGSIFIGLAILIHHYQFIYSYKFFIGCLLGFIGPLLWSYYNVKIDHAQNNSFTIGLYLILGGMLAAIISFILSEKIVISYSNIFYCLLLILGPCSLSYLLWGLSIANLGYLLSFLGYLVPFVSYLLLVLFDIVTFEYQIFLGMCLMLLSAMFAIHFRN